MEVLIPTIVAKFVQKILKLLAVYFSKDFKFDESEYIDKVTKKYEINTFKIPFEEKYFEKNLSSVFYRRGGIHHHGS